MMDKNSNDQSLVKFLQKHAPKAHEPHPGLEDSILDAVRLDVSRGGLQPKSPWRASARTLLTMSLLMCILVVAFNLHYLELANQDLSSMEQFAEESWDGAFATYDDAEFSPLLAELSLNDDLQ